MVVAVVTCTLGSHVSEPLIAMNSHIDASEAILKFPVGQRVLYRGNPATVVRIYSNRRQCVWWLICSCSLTASLLWPNGDTIRVDVEELEPY